MTKFAVRLTGSGCYISIRSERKGFLRRFKRNTEDNLPKIERCGFYTTRFVEAAALHEAAERALEMVRYEIKDIIENLPEQPWEVVVEEVWEASDQYDRYAPGSGFTWYRDSV
jgi:hypothetical protein